MKSTLILFLALGLLILVSCRKENVAEKLKSETEQKVLGKWFVDSTLIEIYQPISQLSSSTKYIGTETDTYSFRPDHIVVKSVAVSGQQEQPFEVVNPFQLIIGSEVWRVEQLTITSLMLKLDRNDVTANQRNVTKIYLKK